LQSGLSAILLRCSRIEHSLQMGDRGQGTGSRRSGRTCDALCEPRWKGLCSGLVGVAGCCWAHPGRRGMGEWSTFRTTLHNARTSTTIDSCAACAQGGSDQTGHGHGASRRIFEIRMLCRRHGPVRTICAVKWHRVWHRTARGTCGMTRCHTSKRQQAPCHLQSHKSHR
jgi:hypothetical protein